MDRIYRRKILAKAVQVNRRFTIETRDNAIVTGHTQATTLYRILEAIRDHG